MPYFPTWKIYILCLTRKTYERLRLLEGRNPIYVLFPSILCQQQQLKLHFVFSQSFTLFFFPTDWQWASRGKLPIRHAKAEAKQYVHKRGNSMILVSQGWNHYRGQHLLRYFDLLSQRREDGTAFLCIYYAICIGFLLSKDRRNLSFVRQAADKTCAEYVLSRKQDFLSRMPC